jgi:Tfp pilus assembly protein PilF
MYMNIYQVKVNALIKRGSLYMQQEKHTEGLDDFATAVRIDPDNIDVYHHRGHVSLKQIAMEQNFNLTLLHPLSDNSFATVNNS